MDKKVVAVVGMAGSGKSEVAEVFAETGFIRVRFGDATDAEIKKRGLPLDEKNERYIRESLRQDYGMDIYAKLNLPRIDEALKASDVVVDGLYSWEEYIFLKVYYGARFCLVAVYSSPQTRYNRLGKRAKRPLTTEEAAGRDRAEIEKVNKGGPIAMADFTIINESSLENMKTAVERVITEIK